MRLSAIGDIVLASPLLRLLRRRFPAAEIDFVVKAEFAELLRYNPNLDALHLVHPAKGMAGLARLCRELRQRRYDVVIDLHRNFRTSLLVRQCSAGRILRYCKPRFRRWLFVQFKLSTMAAIPPVYARYLQAAATLGVEDDRAGPELFWQSQHEEEANTALRSAGWQPEQELIGLAPGAGFFTKRWPVEYFAQLAVEIIRLHPEAGVAILGGPQDAEFGRIIAVRAGHHVLDLTGRCSLLASAAVIKRSRLLIANDSGLMHVAEAVRTPLLALFGSTTRELGFYPQLATSRVLENAALACRPCSHLGHRSCPRGHFRCLREITPERVLHEIQRSWLNFND